LHFPLKQRFVLAKEHLSPWVKSEPRQLRRKNITLQQDTEIASFNHQTSFAKQNQKQALMKIFTHPLEVIQFHLYHVLHGIQ